MTKRRRIGLFLLLLLVPSFLTAQQFGKNKIQYRKQEWHYIQSENFDIYFYGEGQRAAEFTAAVAESSYTYIRKILGYKLRDRIVIAVYNSHNDFEETNLSSSIQEESVGGFTEFFKNRIAIPYEGSTEQFRHVIHHELTHALQLQYFYGTGPGAILGGITGFALPGWFAEGSAEYYSRRWDTESDNFIRDAVLSGYLPDIKNLNAYLAYKGGQSLLYWLEREYGLGKITELNSVLKRNRRTERAFQDVFGQSLDELSKKWHADLKKEYWPEVARRMTPEDFAEPITDHTRNTSFINNAPALSPDGQFIAWLSNESGFFDIYLRSTLHPDQKPRRLISGQKSSGLEEMKWLRPGLSWMPDSKRLIFAAKAGEKDAIHVLDIEQGRIVQSYYPNVDALWSPACSPDGRRVVFMGARAGASDLYLLSLEDGSVVNLLDDPWADLDPSWSPAGDAIVFVSDRAVAEPNAKGVLPPASWENTDIYMIRPDGTGLQRLTDSPYIEKSPLFIHGTDSVLFVSDRNGIDNIYLLDRKTGSVSALTDMITGVDQLALAAKNDRLAFTSFWRGGYDVYLCKFPLTHGQDITTPLQPTPFREREGLEYRNFPVEQNRIASNSVHHNEENRPFQKFVFDPDFQDGRVDTLLHNRGKSPELMPEARLAPDGSYRVKKYTTDFSVDYFGGAGGYDPFWGVQGYTQLLVSDLMGNHQIGFAMNLIQNFTDSDFILSWSWLPLRPDFTVTAFHYAYFFQTYEGIERLRHVGLSGRMRWPLSRFKRIELDAGFTWLQEKNVWYDYPAEVTTALPVSLALVKDNTLFRFFGPFSGQRYRLDAIFTPGLTSSMVSFYSLMFDWRLYKSLNSETGLALRLSGGLSGGERPMLFIFGGLDNWLNPRFARSIERTSITDYFFSRLITPVRGADFYEKTGTRYFLVNAELRFPLVDYLIIRYPLSLGLSQVRGALFLDAGSAWDERTGFRAVKTTPEFGMQLQDLFTSFGWGFRANLGIFLLRMDAFWTTDLVSVSKPGYLFSVGLDY